MNKLYIALILSLVAIAINSNFSSKKNLNYDEKSKNISIIEHKNIDSYKNKMDDNLPLSINEGNTGDFLLDEKESDVETINTAEKNNIKEHPIVKNNLSNDILSTNKNKKSIKPIISDILESYQLGNISNLEPLQEQLAEFNTAESIEELLDMIFSDPATSYEVSQLPDTTKYAIKKIISLAEDRDYIASKLTSIYQNTTDDEAKYRIARFVYPEAYAMIAVEAYNQGDTDIFTEMTQNLIRTDNKHAVDGLMILARKIDTSSIDTVTEIAKKWSDYNLSKDTASLAEDYLSNGASTPKERIIAAAILSNNKKKDKILEKAWTNEENDLVKIYINQYRYSDLINEYQ